MITDALTDAARAWIDRDPDPTTRAEVEALLAAGDFGALADRFDRPLAFGTAGLRAPMRAGPNGMNRLVVRQSAAGIARYLLAEVPDAALRGVVVTHDARHNSVAFAGDCVEVIAAHGIPVHRGTVPLPTPIGVFAVRHLGTAAGIVVTASHNPPADNGLKLYMGDGAQIIPPVDRDVADAIAAVAGDGAVTPDGAVVPGVVTDLTDALIEAYVARTLARVPPPPVDVRIATSAMHGVGGRLLAALLNRAGYREVVAVAAQERPDPDFPTVSFPNPEEPGATDLLVDQVRACGAHVGLALDPDADRVAVVVPGRDGRPRMLTGDQVGALLGEWLLADVTDGPDRLCVSTVVSSSHLARIAAHHGVRHEETLTGFKWLSRPALTHPEWRQVLAYEEAIGYAIGPDATDKDGLSAAVAVASLVAHLHAAGRTPDDLLDDLHRRDGAHVTDNFSLRYAGEGWQERRDAALARFAGSPPEFVGDERVIDVIWLAPDVLRIGFGAGLRTVVRPSGTEPKLKCYCEAVEPVAADDLAAARERAAHRLAACRGGLMDLLT
jgi:phosphomannomutase